MATKGSAWDRWVELERRKARELGAVGEIVVSVSMSQRFHRRPSGFGWVDSKIAPRRGDGDKYWLVLALWVTDSIDGRPYGVATTRSFKSPMRGFRGG